MSMHWRKIWRDIQAAPGRMLLVTLALLVGNAAITVAFGAGAVLDREMQRSMAGTTPADATLWVADADAAVLATVRSHPAIAQADARRLVRTRAEVAPGEWRTLWVFGVADFRDLRVATFTSDRGAWPPAPGELLLERSGLGVLHRDVGDPLRVRAPGGEATLTISGVVHDPALAPAWMENLGYAYATPETLAQLGVGAALDQVPITLVERSDPAQIGALVSEVVATLNEQGVAVQRSELPPPGQQHPHTDQMQAFLILLQFFSLLALALSSTLAASMITTLLAQQVRQIGIVKTLGATTFQVAWLYLRFVLLLALGAVVVGVPVGSWIATRLAAFAAEQLNLAVTSLAVPWGVLVGAALAGVTVPVLVAAVPVLRAARMTAREALQDTGIQMPAGNRTARVDVGDRTVTLALRNTFRRPGRLAMTLLALALGGAVLMTAINLYASIVQGVDVALSLRRDDLDLRLLQIAPAPELVQLAERVPGVQEVEAWGSTLVSLALPGSQARAPLGTQRYPVLAPPPDTDMLHLPLAAGRWLHADETGTVVVTRGLQDREQRLNLRPGQNLTVLYQGQAVPVRVVGVVEEVGPPMLYTTPQTLALLTGTEAGAATLRVVTAPTAATSEAAATLEERLVTAGLFPFSSFTRAEARAAMVDHFLILLLVFVAAAIAVVLVGAMALTSTMSLAVLERQRELGVLRAMGATQATIIRLLLIEGSAMALLSVGLAVMLAWPLSVFGTLLLGNHALHLTLPLVVVPWGILLWLLLAAVLTVLACVAPTRRTGHRSVREVLASS